MKKGNKFTGIETRDILNQQAILSLNFVVGVDKVGIDKVGINLTVLLIRTPGDT